MIAAGAPNTRSPYAVDDYSPAGSTVLTGKSTVSAALVGGETTGVFVTLGQSLIGNNLGTSYTPTSSKVHEVSIYDGLMYGLKDPIIGASGTTGSMVGRIGDALITAGIFQRTIFCNTAIGGSSVYDWTPRGQLNHRLVVAILRLRALGLPISGFMWEQGQTDNVGGTSQAVYLARLQQVIATAAGFGMGAVPWFIALDTINNGPANATIRAAQSAAVNGVNVFAGPDIDTIGGGGRLDGTHLNDTGAATATTLWRNALDAVF